MKNPKLIVKPFAKNGQKNVIPENYETSMESNQATWDQGFGQITMLPVAAGGLPPKGQDFNGIFNQISENIVYLSQGGRFKFSAEYAEAIGGYPKGAILQSDDEKKEYISLIDNNKVDFNTAPDISASWKLVNTDDLLAQIASKQPKGDYATKTELNSGLAGKQPTGDYATKTEVNSKLAKDQNGADIPNKPKFIENLGLPELYFPLTGGVVTGEVKTEKRLIVENSNGFSGIELIGLASTVVIETDAAGSGYIVIRDKSGKNIGSVTLSTLIDVNSFIYPGKIEWCSLPLSEMRPHCYHANGDKYPLTSDVGKALRSLSQGYKAAHGIVESDGMINMPNAYHSDGRGYFFRANALGLKQEDISRRIYGAIGIEKGIELPTSYGAFTQNFVDIDSASHTGVSRSSKGTWNFDSANVTPTGNENRPISYGLIPIVYLGV